MLESDSSMRRSQGRGAQDLVAYFSHLLSCQECVLPFSAPDVPHIKLCSVAQRLGQRADEAWRPSEVRNRTLRVGPPAAMRKPAGPTGPMPMGEFGGQYMVQIRSMLDARPECSCDFCVYWAACIALAAAGEAPFISKLTLMLVGVSVPDFLQSAGTNARGNLDMAIQRRGKMPRTRSAPQARPVPKALFEPSTTPWHAEPIELWRTSDEVGPPAPGVRMFPAGSGEMGRGVF